MGRARPWATVVVVAGAVAAASACAGPGAGPDAATVDVAFTGAAVFTDSFSRCVVTLRSTDGDVAAGAVLECPELDPEPSTAQLAVPPGTYVVEVGQWACPGMPGDCSEEPDDETYLEERRGGSGLPTWQCSLRVDLASRTAATVEVSGTDRDSTACRVVEATSPAAPG